MYAFGAKSLLIERIKSNSAVLGVFGLGYVGLPIALSFIKTGFKVFGIDADYKKINDLKSGNSYIKHISSERIRAAIVNGFQPVTDFSVTNELDILIICVPTPLTKYREPDLSCIEKTLDSIIPYLRQGQLISLESTTYPGTTREVILPRVTNFSKDLKIGENFFIGYSPEREDPGNKNFSINNIPKICSGITKNCLDVMITTYKKIVEKVVPVSSPEVAEMTKLLENIHRAVNIGLVNEMKMLAHKMGMDIYEVIDAAATKPFGFAPYYPGPGLGGHCIPVDPFYLTWKAREYGLCTRFIELSGEINASMPEWVVSRIIETLNNEGKPLKGAKVLLLGISYKKNVDDLRESPSLDIIELLQERGVVIQYNDSFFPTLSVIRKYKLNLSSVELTIENLKQYDCVVIATDHDSYDYTMIQKYSNKIVDTRGVYRTKYNNVEKA